MSRKLNQKSIFLGAGVAVAGISLTCLWLVSGRSLESTSHAPNGTLLVTRAPDASSADLKLKTTALQFQPKAGRSYFYAFERSISFRGFPSTSGTEPSLRYQGVLRLDVLGSDGQGFEAQVGMELLGPKKAAEYSAFRTLKLHASISGREIRLMTTAAVSDSDRQQDALIKDLLSLWLFPLRMDTVGEYAAHFETVASDGKGERVKKVKSAYLKTGYWQPPHILKSNHFLRWDQELSLPQEVKGEESSRMGDSDSSLAAESSYSIHFVKSGGIKDLLAIQHADYSIQDKLQIDGNTQSSLAGEVPSLTWSGLSDELLDLENRDGSAKLRIFGNLVRFLRTHPENLSDLLAMARSQGAIRLGAQSSLFKTLVGALASLGDARPQTALIDIYRNEECPVSGKGSILAALTTTPNPLSPSTQEFLTHVMKFEAHPDLAQGAAFALGSSIQNEPGSAHSEAAVQTLKSEWNAAGTQESQRLALLDAMGNSGSAEFLPELRSVIDGPQPSVQRAKAVFALRWIEATEATALLSMHASDSDARVRQAAVDALEIKKSESINRSQQGGSG